METTFSLPEQHLIDRQEFFRLVGTGVGAILLTRCITGCASSGNPDPSPNAARKIDFTVNLNEKKSENLAVKGGYIIINDVIVAQTKDGQYIAVAANCTHQGTQLVYKSADNQFYCPLHLSRFDPTGKVVVGPATQSLQQYTVTLNPTSGLIRVTN
jgi:cytochrome b6-f complex iron-sulfur subunit